MSKREKVLGLSFLVIVILLAHIYAGMKLKAYRAKQQEEIDSLTSRVETYQLTENSAKLIQEEVNWIDAHSPPAKSFQNAQTELQNFLISSSKRLGFTPYAQNLIAQPESDINPSLEVDNIEQNYQRVKIQISARATEKQIYQWLVDIHQPQKMRVLSFLKLTPPSNDTNLINCQIIAEQYILVE